MSPMDGAWTAADDAKLRLVLDKAWDEPYDQALDQPIQFVPVVGSQGGPQLTVRAVDVAWTLFFVLVVVPATAVLSTVLLAAALALVVGVAALGLLGVCLSAVFLWGISPWLAVGCIVGSAVSVRWCRR